MMIRIVVLLCFGVVYTQVAEDANNISEDTRNVTEIKKFLDSYKEKICKSENTCHLLNMVPKNLQTLKDRNCMCDADCAVYGDCCEDSAYSNNYEHFQAFHCSVSERVYMKTSCPKNYTNISVKSKCESSTGPLKTSNKKVFIPVTNIITNITYGNEYCAICNNDYQYEIWNLTSHCSEQYSTHNVTQNVTEKVTENTTQSLSSVQFPKWRSEPNQNFKDQYVFDLEEAKKRIQFNPKNKTFFSFYNNKFYDCWYKRNIPVEVLPHIRDCVDAIDKCSVADETLINICTSYTSIVYTEQAVAYKNKDCAYCNGVTKNLKGCFDLQDTRIKGSSLFSTVDKSSGNKPACNNSSLKNKFC